MGESLKIESRIPTNMGGDIIIEKYLAEGGQGEVYVVNYNGEHKALKWYKKTVAKENGHKLYDNLQKNINKGSPSKEFLWPIDLTKWYDESFGYIMDLRPKGYFEVKDFMLRKDKAIFENFKIVTDAALNIVSAFWQLHNKGFSYQDINDGNFFINPKNGKVLICDNDNVAPDGADTGILGKPRYMAPEIVTGKYKPDNLSDRFSMSVIVYILYCLNHPLEGKRYYVPALTPDKQKELYGTDPIFMFDEEDDRNRPHSSVNENSIIIWNALPEYMRKMFLEAFSKKSFEKPSSRLNEVDLLKTLVRFRSDIIRCPSCGGDIFTENGIPKKCDRCGKMPSIPCKLHFVNADYSIPALKDTRIYKCQIGVTKDAEALEPLALVLEKQDKPGMFGIRNKSQKIWKAVTSKGQEREVPPDEVIPIKDGIKFQIDNEIIEILANN